MRELPPGITEAFAIEGAFLEAAPIGNGHIHRTFEARYAGSHGRDQHVVHQELNTEIFDDPWALMRNVERICEHVRERAAHLPDSERRALPVIRARDGAPLYVDESGAHWRTYAFVERTVSHERVVSAAQAEATARAFATFVAQLDDLPGDALATTIPHFHDTPKRWRGLREAISRDAAGRADEITAQLANAEAIYRWLEREGEERRTSGLPRRTVHNDCKLNNLLCDEVTGEPLCVIDLDTVMEGTVLFDFGELVRTSASNAPEDTTEPDAMQIDDDILAALARGYVQGASSFLTPAEREALPMAGPLLAFENGIRFLTDHLDGDRYFRIHREGHNLDRANAQLRLAELLTKKLDVTAEAIDGR